MLRTRLHAHCIRLLIATVICAVAAGCRNNSNSAEQDALACRSFIDKQVELASTGKLANKNEIPRKIDSFYASGNHSFPLSLCVKYNTLSSYFYEMGVFDSANYYADSGLYLMEKSTLSSKFHFDYINLLCSKAQALYAEDKFNQAYNYYYKAKQLTAQMKDTCALLGVPYGLAMTAYKQKKFREAAEYFKSSYLTGSLCTALHTYQLQEDLDNIALCYERLGLPDSALYYYDSTISFIRHQLSSQGEPIVTQKPIAVVYGNMGGVFLAKGQTDTAITLLKKSYDINIQPHYDNRDALLTHLKLASAYLKKNDLSQMQQALTAIRREMDTIDHPLEAESNWRQLMYQYYERTGNEAAAFEYYRTYTALRDSLWEKEKTQLQNDVAKELKDKQQMNEIDLLQKENHLSSSYLFVTIGFSVLALAIVTLVYMNYKRSKKSVQKLTLLNNRVKVQKQQLEGTSAELLKSNKDKDRILHMVAHDLRNPISAVMMLCDMMRQDAHTDADKESLDMMMSASQSALALIGELLEFSGDAKAGTAKKETANVNELVKHSTDLLQFKAREKKQSLNLALLAEPLYVRVNKEKINRVLGNVITNAIKFSPEHSAIYISVHHRNEQALVEIKDNGIGIPKELQPKIFEPFTSAKRFGTSGEKSFGLGLSICKQIVEANDGKIWMESAEGQGSTFFIEFPVIQK